jgi:tetratricopeptide (TPR) repeat protein
MAFLSMIGQILLLNITLLQIEDKPNFDLKDYLKEANKNFWKGNYNQAIKGYQKMLNLGLKLPDIYFNLGNAYFRANKLGLAIWAYEQTLKLNPKDKEARQNLSLVKSKLAKRRIKKGGLVQIEKKPSPITKFYEQSSLNQFLICFVIFYGMLFLALILKTLFKREEIKICCNILAPLCLLFTLFFLGLSLSKIYQSLYVHHGIIIVKKDHIREGPYSKSEALFVVYEGDKVQILDQDLKWLKVRTNRGKTGWIKKQSLAKLDSNL